jgi:hypothetical protein
MEKPEGVDYFTTQSSTAVLKFSIEDGRANHEKTRTVVYYF